MKTVGAQSLYTSRTCVRQEGPAVKFVAERAHRALGSQAHALAKKGLQLSLLPGEPTEHSTLKDKGPAVKFVAKQANRSPDS